MKQLTIILVAAVIFLTLGCEKRAGQAEEAARYDAEIDGPTCMLTVSTDENLLADQKKISRQARLDVESAEESTTPAPAADPAGEVRQVMIDLIANFKAGRMDRLAAALPSAEAAALRKFFNDFDKLNPKRESLKQLFKTKLKMEPPPDVKTGLSKDMFIYAIFGVNFSKVSLDDLDIKQVGETVVISGPNVRKVTFFKDGQVWKIQISPDARQLAGLLDEIVSITEKMGNELISGINNGSVTKDNHRAKMVEIEQRHGAVMGAKIRALMSNLLIPGMMPAPATSPPTSDTPAAKPVAKPAAKPVAKPAVAPAVKRPRPGAERRRPVERGSPERREREFERERPRRRR